MAKPTTIDEYLARVSEDKRAALEDLRASIHALFPGVEECISYNMPGFRLEGRVIAWMGAAARHCSFFPGGGVEAFRDDLGAYGLSKGTVRFRADQRLPKTIIRKLIQAHIDRLRRRRARPDPASTGRGATGRTTGRAGTTGRTAKTHRATGRPTKTASATGRTAATAGAKRGKINAAWHRDHRMPANATLAQRIAWHRAHARHCGCRPVPASIRPYLEGGAR